MKRSISCDYNDTCIHVKGVISIPNTETATVPDN